MEVEVEVTKHGVLLHNHIAFWQTPELFNQAALDFLLAK